MNNDTEILDKIKELLDNRVKEKEVCYVIAFAHNKRIIFYNWNNKIIKDIYHNIELDDLDDLEYSVEVRIVVDSDASNVEAFKRVIQYFVSKGYWIQATNDINECITMVKKREYQ